MFLSGNSPRPASAAIGGPPIDPSDPYPFAALGVFRAQSAYCEAVLVGEDWALTAEHCLDKDDNDRSKGQYTAGQITVTFGSVSFSGKGGDTRSVLRIIPEGTPLDPHGGLVVGNANPSQDRKDQVLLQLSPSTASITPIPLGSVCRSWNNGGPMFMAGWGNGSDPRKTMQEVDLTYEGDESLNGW